MKSSGKGCGHVNLPSLGGRINHLAGVNDTIS